MTSFRTVTEPPLHSPRRPDRANRPETRPSDDCLQKLRLCNIVHTVTDASPVRIVALSTIGAQATRISLLTQLQMMEQTLGELPIPIAFLRAAWFMENAAWDVEPAVKDGVIPSFLQPLDKPVPMVATADVGRVAADLLLQNWTGRLVVELEGPQRVTPNDIAATFSRLLNRTVLARAVPRDTWPSLFASQGIANPEPRIQMLDGSMMVGSASSPTKAKSLRARSVSKACSAS